MNEIIITQEEAYNFYVQYNESKGGKGKSPNWKDLSEELILSHSATKPTCEIQRNPDALELFICVVKTCCRRFCRLIEKVQKRRIFSSR